MDWRVVRAVLACGLLIVLSGCIAQDVPPRTQPLSDAVIAAPLAWQGDCTAPLMVASPTFSQVAGLLPGGFHPGDPQEVFGTPVAVGRAIVLIMTIDCPDALEGRPDPTAFAFTGILIEAPAGFADRPGFDLYEVSTATDGWLADAFTTHGWTVHGVAPDVTTTLDPDGGYLARVDYPGPAGTGTYQVAATAQYPQTDWDVRLWHQDGGRRGYWSFHAAQQPLLGTVTCSYPADSVEAVILGGSTSCSLSQVPTFGGVFHPFGFTAQLVQVAA